MEVRLFSVLRPWEEVGGHLPVVEYLLFVEEGEEQHHVVQMHVEEGEALHGQWE